MKNTPVYIFLFTIFLGCGTIQNGIEEDLLLGKWRWSCEMFDGDFNNLVYRHFDDEEIRLCRGVQTFTFHADGKFDYYGFFCIPPGLKNKGEWKYDGKNLYLYYSDSDPIVYDVLKLDEKQLVLMSN